MANFFKDYQANVKEKAKAKEKEINKTEKIEYTNGQIVYINPIYDCNRNGKRYFVDYLSGNHVLLAKTKKDSLNGYGYIYDKSCIIK